MLVLNSSAMNQHPSGQPNPKSNKKQKPQFKLYLPDELIEELTEKAERYDLRSPQQIAEEIVRDYLPLWEQAEIVRRNKVAKQLEEYNPENDADVMQSLLREVERCRRRGKTGSKKGAKVKSVPLVDAHPRRQKRPKE